MAGSTNKRGFTLIEVLLVLVILSILVCAVVLSVGYAFGTSDQTAYISVKEQVQTALIAPLAKSPDGYPVTGNTTIIDGKTLDVIDVCALIVYDTPSGMLRKTPDGFMSNADNDNCDSQEFNCSCNAEAHYIWAVDTNGQVYSSCINTSSNGGGCANTGLDGFQNIWP